MDTSPHNLTNLFAQLGLKNSNEDIKQFVATHKIPSEQTITQANFWTSSQKHFLTESLMEDGDWSEIIDQFDILLRS